METVRWLYDLQHFGIKLGLDNIRRMLELLEHPERALRTVLVGGTNGKGSVAAMLHSMLGAHGVGTGLFTSPHLVRPNERIRIGRKDIDDAALDVLLQRIREVVGRGLATEKLDTPPSFFEVITAAALKAFADAGLRAAVLEVGLGGRLDATNAVDADLSVVTGVDLDHTKTLGSTIEMIAHEKAGIIKPGRVLVSGAVRPEAIAVLRQVCVERGATFVSADETVEFSRFGDVHVGLAGRHQIGNARIALAALHQLAPALDVELDPAAVRAGLADVRWAARLQWIDVGSRRLLLDGAHNPAGAETLAEYMDSLDDPPRVALFGAMHGKLLGGILAPLARTVHSVVVARPDVRRAADPRDVADEARRHFDHVEIVPDPLSALERAASLAGEDSPVLVTGSLYLIGQVLASFEHAATPGPVSM